MKYSKKRNPFTEERTHNKFTEECFIEMKQYIAKYPIPKNDDFIDYYVYNEFADVNEEAYIKLRLLKD